MCKKKSSFYRKGLDSLINSCKFVITILGVFLWQLFKKMWMVMKNTLCQSPIQFPVLHI